MIVIRPTKPDDLEALTAIFNAVVKRGDVLVYDEPLTNPQLREYFAAFTNLFTAESDGRVVGGYCLRANAPGRGSHVANAVYVVEEASRGKGVGRLLGEHSLAEARELGFRAMQFNAVVASNDIAITLWRDLGFDIVGTIPQGFRHANGLFVDLFIMYRRL